MRNFILSLASVFILLVIPSTILSQTPAFPGAEGGGKYVTGGRGGTVYFVNTLEDTNTGNTTTREGSLRWCLGRTEARTIVFRVGGIITLKSRLNISRGNLTIAGQTAPGDGICIKDYEVVVDADNVIIRYMRFRLGDEITTHEPDALWGRYRNNIIIDHCSISWSIDEAASFYSNSNFTMQWCFITESLNSSIHDKGNHGYGGLWGGKNASFHHNLLAHHNSRNPRFNGWKRSGLSYTNPLDEERLDFRNNVIYNWGGNSGYGGEAAGKYNIVANYYKPGLQTSSGSRSRIVNVDIDGGTAIQPRWGKFYVTGNYFHNNTSVTSNNWNGVTYASGVDKVACRADVPFENIQIPQHTAEKAFEKVLNYGGASLVRDAVDTRISGEVLNGTYTYTGSKTGYKGIIDTQTDVGGWPEYKSATPPADSNSDGIPDNWLETNFPGKTANQINEDGYTYLEVYLNSLVADITYNQYLEASDPTGMNDVIYNSDIVKVSFIRSGNFINISSESMIQKVSIYDISGKMVMERVINHSNATINSTILPKGIYIVKSTLADNTKFSSKIIK